MGLTRHSYISAFFATLLISFPVFGQYSDSIKITFPQGPVAEAYLHYVLLQPGRYISLNDFARALSIPTHFNLVTGKMEMNLTNARFRFTANNCFVAVTDPWTGRQTLNQFPLPVLAVRDTIYAPLYFFLPLVTAETGTLITLDSAAMRAFMRMDSIALLPKPDITSLTVERKRNGYLIRILSFKKLSDVDRFMRNDEWLYLTLPDVLIDTTALNATPASDIIEQVVATQYESSAQLAFKLKRKINSSEIVRDTSTSDILVALHTTVAPRRKSTRIRQPEAETAKPEDERQKAFLNNLQKQRSRWKLDVVVIDAGHGGNDPGSIGTVGTREKDITLGTALKLGSLIERQMPDVKVVYTRKTDRFVELYRRGQIANENQGKLFVSIHCNSMDRKPSAPNGFEIYLLRPGKSEDAIKIAQKENEVVKLEQDYQSRYQEITEENFILLTMAQSAYMKQSEHFAGILQREMEKRLHSESRGVKQAGFYVLVGASMPNVLIETGYLSNRKDEMALRSPAGQHVIAESIFNALKKYKSEYERSLE